MMNTLSELTIKANYIASKNNHLKSQWHAYQTCLTQAVIHSNKKINHEFRCGEDCGIHFRLFNHFLINVHLGEEFYSQDIIYSLNMATGNEGDNFQPFARARLSDDGRVDFTVNTQDKDAVLEHYLNKISAIYQCIFDALKNNQPVQAQLENLLRNLPFNAEKKESIVL
ncbi:formate hydrogenlyase regulator HycA [Pantoea agglomerans]|uniref:formate hydrogenlyase regulator HycA n=1 Tax=Enterobacter agglomerans TaxID=549 RepID=UPI003DA049B1